MLISGRRKKLSKGFTFRMVYLQQAVSCVVVLFKPFDDSKMINQ